MNRNTTILSYFISLIPTLGITIFLISSLFITRLYPGGSLLDNNSIGFNWSQNYWCHLFESIAINGQINEAKNISIAATLGMFLSVSLFFFSFANSIHGYNKKKKIILFFGILSMLIAPFVMTDVHDVAVIISGIMCSIAIITIFSVMYNSCNYYLLVLGFVWVILFIVNYVMYFGNFYIEKLPVVQKIAFLSFFAWIIFTNFLLVINQKTSKAPL